ncbi:MAG: LTA synthase family protein [Magnetospiraceae bacterium]
MVAFLVGLVAIFVAVLVLERLVKPRRQDTPMMLRARLIGTVPLITLYLLFVMISYRPIFATLLTITIFLAIVLLNNAKFKALKEPLVYSDFALLRQAIEHPQLYVKYIGVHNIILIFVLGAGAIALGFIFEPPMVARDQLVDYLPLFILLAIGGFVGHMLIWGRMRRPLANFLLGLGPSADVTADLSKLSLVATLIVYFFLSREENVPLKEADGPNPESNGNTALPAETEWWRRTKNILRGVERLPSIVAIQSESFFDARRLHESIDPSILAQFDHMVANSHFHGRLTVPAWGANTMRTEFSFLTGLANEDLGFNRFNPFLSLAKSPVWTLARAVKMLGYRTVCIHPFYSTFFARDRVYPALGFDHFLDIKAFEGAETFGPYISDVEVGEKILEVLGESEQPAFIFAITMENHGRWEKNRFENVAGGDQPRYGGELTSLALEFYLRHLRNTDAVIGRLTGQLDSPERDTVLCLFGDHLPSMPKLFKKLNYDDDKVDYVIWRTGGAIPQARDVSVEGLGSLVMRAVGIDLEDSRPAMLEQSRETGRPMASNE